LTKIDDVIETIKKSKDREEAKTNLIKKFKLTAIQAEAILEIRLHQLAKLEKKKIEDELEEKRNEMREYEKILASKIEQKKVLKNDLEKK